VERYKEEKIDRVERENTGIEKREEDKARKDIERVK